MMEEEECFTELIHDLAQWWPLTFQNVFKKFTNYPMGKEKKDKIEVYLSVNGLVSTPNKFTPARALEQDGTLHKLALIAILANKVKDDDIKEATKSRVNDKTEAMLKKSCQVWWGLDDDRSGPVFVDEPSCQYQKLRNYCECAQINSPLARIESHWWWKSVCDRCSKIDNLLEKWGIPPCAHPLDILVGYYITSLRGKESSSSFKKYCEKYSHISIQRSTVQECQPEGETDHDSDTTSDSLSSSKCHKSDMNKLERELKEGLSKTKELKKRIDQVEAEIEKLMESKLLYRDKSSSNSDTSDSLENSTSFFTNNDHDNDAIILVQGVEQDKKRRKIKKDRAYWAIKQEKYRFSRIEKGSLVGVYPDGVGPPSPEANFYAIVATDPDDCAGRPEEDVNIDEWTKIALCGMVAVRISKSDEDRVVRDLDKGYFVCVNKNRTEVQLIERSSVLPSGLKVIGYTCHRSGSVKDGVPSFQGTRGVCTLISHQFEYMWIDAHVKQIQESIEHLKRTCKSMKGDMNIIDSKTRKLEIQVYTLCQALLLSITLSILFLVFLKFGAIKGHHSIKDDYPLASPPNRSCDTGDPSTESALIASRAVIDLLENFKYSYDAS